MVNLESLFQQFKREKQYLLGVSPATVRSYNKSWLAFTYHYGCTHVLPTEASVKAVMVSWLEGGLSPGAANSYARSVNSFLSWLHESSHTETRLRIPLTKEPRRVLRTYTEEQVAIICRHKPTSRTQRRILTLLYLLIDTGARINEALTLTRKNVDFDNMQVTLYGKGGKERRVPISPTLRRELFRWLNSHSHALVFCTRDGEALRYDNVKRDFLALLEAVGVEKSEGSFHAFRRYFGKAYLRNGGNLVYLQRLLGHTTLEMTKRYVEADEEDLRQAHKSLSPLEGVKKR